jgi:hypothetical protein
MAQADSVLSTPPTNTPVDTTRRRFLAVPDLASPDNHPFKTRNGRLTIPAHRLHDHVKVDMYRVQAVAGGTAAAFS